MYFLLEARSAFPWFESYQAASASLYDQVWMTGWRFTSSMPAHNALFEFVFAVTRMWRRTDRANLDKKPSMRLSHEPCLGVKVNSKRPGGRASSQALVSLDMCAERLSRTSLIAVLAPRSANRKTRNPPSTHRFHDAGFMESVV